MPAAVAVVVAFDPGPWFEDCLASLGAQDYPNCSLLVVDNASAQPLAGRVASVAPHAYVLRTEENQGFAAGANVVLAAVENAAFYLFCHDDVVLAPDALRHLVEAAYRDNAGIVAPKIVDGDDADRLLQVGVGVDRLGVPVDRVERGELDQGQHDEAHEVFAAPSACMLVRADLFAVVGGFDAEMRLFGEDTDLAWRARLAGARVAVEPAAVVRHFEATATRRRWLPEARLFRRRHEVRSVLKNYGPARRRLALGQLAVITVVELFYFLLLGNAERRRELLQTWRWNLAPERGLAQARAAVAAQRRVPDRVVAHLFSHRTSRLWRLLRPHLPPALGGPGIFDAAAEQRATERIGAWARSAGAQSAAALKLPSTRAPGARPTRHRAVVAVALIAAFVFLLGSRSILFGTTPLVGRLLPIPGAQTLLGDFFGGWTDAGVQAAGPATPAFALLGVLAAVFTGAHGLALDLVQVACVALGAFGAARLVRPLAPPAARLVAGVSYLFLPLGANVLSTGDLRALAGFAAMPYVLGRLQRAEVGRGRPGLREVTGLGVLLALVGAFSPGAFVAALVAAAAAALGALVAGAPRRAARSSVVALCGAGVALLLLFPWSLTFFQRGARLSALLGVVRTGAAALHLADLLRFATGPIGHGPLALAPLGAAAVVLAIGRGERLERATQWWVTALGTVAFAFAASQGLLGGGGGASAVLLAPAAAALSACIGLGAAAVHADLPRARLGWRHLLAAVGGVLALAGLFPVLSALSGGAWGRAATGYDTVLAVPAPAGADTARVLWLGNPEALPLPAWQVRPGFGLAVSTGALPDARRLYPSANPGGAEALAAAVATAEAGRTVRLGHLLSAERITAVVVPETVAPALGSLQRPRAAPAPAGLVDALLAQIDLHELPVEAGTLVFENTAWRALPASAPTGGTPAPVRALGVAFELLAWIGALARLLARRGRLDDAPAASVEEASSHVLVPAEVR